MEDIKKAAKIAEESVSEEARSAAEKLMQKQGDDFWNEFYGYRASSLIEKPIINGGAVERGGGSKSGKKSKKPKKKGDMAYLYLDA